MADDEILLVGAPLRRILTVSPCDGFRVTVVWTSPTSDAAPVVVDLAPAIFRYGT